MKNKQDSFPLGCIAFNRDVCLNFCSNDKIFSGVLSFLGPVFKFFPASFVSIQCAMHSTW